MFSIIDVFYLLYLTPSKTHQLGTSSAETSPLYVLIIPPLMFSGPESPVLSFFLFPFFFYSFLAMWPWSRVQSWRAWVCICFCSQECPVQEPAFVDSSVVSEGFPCGASGLPFPSPEDLTNPGIKPGSPALLTYLRGKTSFILDPLDYGHLKKKS